MPELGEAQVAVRAKLDKLDNDLSKAKKKVEESASGLDKTLSKIGDAAKGALAAMGVREVVQFTQEMYALGGEVERANASLNELTDGQAASYIEAVGIATRGTVSDMEAVQIATRLYGMGLVDSAEAAGKMARTSAILGATFSNLGAAEAAENVALLLANMSYARLDTFGVSSGRVRARVNELKDAFPEMTTEAAFTQAAMEALTEKADTLSGVLDDSTAESEKLGATLRGVKEDYAEWVAEGIQPAVHWLNEQIAAQKELRDATRAEQYQIAAVSDSFEDYTQRLYDAGLINKQLNDLIQSGTTNLGRAAGPVQALQRAYEGYQDELEQVRQTQNLTENSSLQLGMSQAQLAGVARDVAQATAEQARSEADLDHALVTGQISVEEYTAAKRDYMTEAQQAAEIVRDEAAALQEQAKAADEAYRAQKDLRDFVAGLAEDQEKYGGALVRSGAGFDNFISFLEDSGQAAGLTTDQIDQWAVSYGALTPEQLQQKQLLGELEQAMTRYDETFTPDEWRDAFDLVQTGQLNAAQAALDNEVAQAQLTAQLLAMDPAAQTMAQSAEDANQRVSDAVDEAQPALDAAETTLHHIKKIWDGLQGNPVLNLTVHGGFNVGSDYIPKAAGGPVYPGQGYLVGEKGPEFFMPDTAGSIIPNHALGSADMLHEMGASGGTQVVFNFYPTVNAPAGLMDPAIGERLAWDLAKPIVQEIKNSNLLRELIA